MKVLLHRSKGGRLSWVSVWLALVSCTPKAPVQEAAAPEVAAPKPATATAQAAPESQPVFLLPPAADAAGAPVAEGRHGKRKTADGVAGEAHGVGGLGLVGSGRGGGGIGYGYGMGAKGVSAASTYGVAGAVDDGAFNTEAYAHQAENEFRGVAQAPLSTFSIDVDTASYSNMRRFLRQGSLPPEDAIRVEELINYFPYEYKNPLANDPFAANVEVATCPWAPKHKLVRIGIKARDLDAKQRPASNLTFLIDVSGSMHPDNKLPLLKRALALLASSLDARDRVSIVVYAGASGVVLQPTKGDQFAAIVAALANLEAGGSTNGAAGIELAYQLAQKGFIQGGSNRVILATDGDFNVGLTHEGGLVRLIEEKAKTGVFLSVLGFGQGNVKDATMEKLADKGNGNYAYIDTLQEARKVLVEQMTGTLVTVAKDVKLQIEFNPNKVGAYRQVGYENRQLKTEDFNNDKIDAGDIGAGHTVTALYEIVPAGVEVEVAKVDPLKYRAPSAVVAGNASELATVKIRYKPPTKDASMLSSFVVEDSDHVMADASIDFRFATAVAELGMLLRDSKHRGTATYADALALARGARGSDPHGYRAELIQLVELAQTLKGQLTRR